MCAEGVGLVGFLVSAPMSLLPVLLDLVICVLLYAVWDHEVKMEYIYTFD